MLSARSSTFTIAVLVFPFFNHANTAAFIEPLRAANLAAQRALFQWCWVSANGGEVAASDGSCVATQALDTVSSPNLLLVSSGALATNELDNAMCQCWAKWDSQGVILVGLDGGVTLLAGAGLLRGQRAAVPVEWLDRLRQQHRQVLFTAQRQVIEARRMTAYGNLASTECALALIERLYGRPWRDQVYRQLFHSGPAALTTRSGLPAADEEGLVRRAVEIMQARLGCPISLSGVCTQLQVSGRQLNRAFQRTHNCSPRAFYHHLRLRTAQQRLRDTCQAVDELAVELGFSSAAQFSRAYRRVFGHTPRQSRMGGGVVRPEP